ncbi:BMC domain-containing protein [Candidatus Dependentiae bacterium]|nr:BMC domain-containing protein [Candidatus Dependentiae bacterium]
MKNAIGLVEVSSISQGFLVVDEMLKAAEVELLIARTICSGKHITLVCGEVGAVKASVETGIRTSDFAFVDSIIIPNIHESVFPAIRGLNTIENPDALGIVESFSISSLIEGADAAVKAAQVELIEIRLAMALGGKAFFTVTGTVADVKAGVESAKTVIGEKGLLVNAVVIPGPRPEIYRELL